MVLVIVEVDLVVVVVRCSGKVAVLVEVIIAVVVVFCVVLIVDVGITVSVLVVCPVAVIVMTGVTGFAVVVTTAVAVVTVVVTDVGDGETEPGRINVAVCVTGGRPCDTGMVIFGSMDVIVIVEEKATGYVKVTAGPEVLVGAGEDDEFVRPGDWASMGNPPSEGIGFANASGQRRKLPVRAVMVKERIS